MNNINTTNSSFSFKSLNVKGEISPKNVKKLGDFASHIENINFIKDLEKDFNVNVILDNEISKMSFAHKEYGDLSGKYGCESYPLENVFRDITEVLRSIKSAVNKASKDYQKTMSEIEAIKRGC